MKTQIESIERWVTEKEDRSAVVLLTEDKDPYSLVIGDKQRLIASIVALMGQDIEFMKLISDSVEKLVIIRKYLKDEN